MPVTGFHKAIPFCEAFGWAVASLNWRALPFCPRLPGRESHLRTVSERSLPLSSEFGSSRLRVFFPFRQFEPIESILHSADLLPARAIHIHPPLSNRENRNA